MCGACLNLHVYIFVGPWNTFSNHLFACFAELPVTRFEKKNAKTNKLKPKILDAAFVIGAGITKNPRNARCSPSGPGITKNPAQPLAGPTDT